MVGCHFPGESVCLMLGVVAVRTEIEDVDTSIGKALLVVWPNEPAGALGENLLEIDRERNRLDALECEALAAFDASNEFRDDGAMSTATWVAHRSRARRNSIARRTHIARRLRTMPHTATAFAAGDISLDHVEVLVKANLPSLAEKFAECEERLVDHARTLSYDDFCRVVRYWRDVADPDDAERRAQTMHEARDAHSSATFDGMGRLDAWFDPISHQAFDAELRRRYEALLEADWAEARARLGDMATVNDLGRTPGQRRLDALTEMSRRSRALDGDATETDITTNLLMDKATFDTELAKFEAEQRGEDPDLIAYPEERLCEFADGTIITPAQGLSLAMAGYVRGLAVAGDGHPLYFGRKRRFFVGAQREAVMLAFPTCDEEGCEIRSEHCQIDHVLAWIDGGMTDTINARPRCTAHNLWKERLRQRERNRQRSS